MRALLLILLLATATAPCAMAAEEKNPDPWVKLNRATHRFNHVVDRILFRPLAKVYSTIVPGFARAGVRRFFENLDEVNNSLNSFLQGKPHAGFACLGRLTINSTIGIGGWFDPATAMGIKGHQEDFGQTFAVWGIPRGPYLEIPFLGPSTVEDAFGRPLNALVDPVRYLYPVRHRNRLYLTRAVSDRASLLPVEAAVFGDEYLFYRDAYLQRRDYLIHDGKVEDTFGDF